MTEDELMATLRAVRHKILDLLQRHPDERIILLDDDGELGAVIVPAEWYKQASLFMATREGSW